MNTAVTLFENNAPVPVYLVNNPAAKALAEQMEGGLAGRQINKLSLKNSKFRFMKQGVEIAVLQQPSLDVVIVAANPTVGRLWWEGGYEGADSAGKRPDCYSRDGIAPEQDSPKQQSTHCATCPQNAKGSAKNGKGKACSYKKRTVLVAPGKIDGDAYALDVGSMSMFGDDQPQQRLYKLKGYIEALKANGLIVPAVVTKLSFDDNESVPVLNFTPVRPLTEAEWRQVEARLNDPAIRDMLDDVDLKSEDGVKPGNGAAVQQLPQTAAAPAAPVQQQAAPVPAPAPAAAAPAPVAHKPRGRPAKADTPPVQAPAPSAPPPAADGFGFPTGAPAAAAPVQPQAAPAAPAAQGTAPAGFSINLDEFDA